MEIFITLKVLVATAITICGPKDVKGSLPGKWGPWSEVSACSTSCGMGVHERKRIWETNPPQKSPFTMTHTIACYEGSCTGIGIRRRQRTCHRLSRNKSYMCQDRQFDEEEYSMRPCSYDTAKVPCSNHKMCRIELFRECQLVNSWYWRYCPLMCNMCSSTASPTTASSVGAEGYLTSTIDIQSFVEGQTGETVTSENQSSAACADKETCTRQAKIEDCNLTGSWSSTNCPALCGLCLRVQGSPTSAIQMDSIVPTALMQAYVTADTTEYSGGAISTSGKRANENLNEVQVAGIVVGISIIVTIAIVAFCIFWVKKGKRMLRAPRRRPSRKSSIRRSLKRKPAESVMNYPDLNVTSDLDDDIRLSHFERSRPSIRHDRNDVSCLQETVLHETNSKEQARRSPPTSTYYHLSVADHLSDSDFSYPI